MLRSVTRARTISLRCVRSQWVRCVSGGGSTTPPPVSSKRAIPPEHIQGVKGSKEGGGGGAAAAAAAAAGGPSAAPTAESSGSGLLPLAIGGIVIGGMGYAYYTNFLKSPTVKGKDGPKLETSSPKEKILKEEKSIIEEAAAIQTDAQLTEEGAPEPNAAAADDSELESTEERTIETPDVAQADTFLPMDEKVSKPVMKMDSSPTEEVDTPEQISVVTPENRSESESSTEAEEPKDVSKQFADSSMTEKAIAELRQSQTDKAVETLVKSHQSMWTSMDSSIFDDLDNLTTSQLKVRIVQLAMEMKDRTKWEAVRLKEFLAMKEKEVADQYLQVLHNQRLEFESFLAARLREQENALLLKLREALQEKDASVQSVINHEIETLKHELEEEKNLFKENVEADIRDRLEAEFEAKEIQMTKDLTGSLDSKIAELEALKGKVEELERALDASESGKEGSVRAHRLSAAALALSEKLETNESASSELRALKTVAGSDGVIGTALLTIPDAAETGVATLPELQARFSTVHAKSRQAALVPAGRLGLDGQLAGMVFAALKYPPSPNDPVPENADENAEYILFRARNHVELGQLEEAVELLEKLKGQPALVVEDWKRDAMNRFAVEKALRVIKMECALLNESLAK